MNKYGNAHFVLKGVTSTKFSIMMHFCQVIFFSFANSADSDEMLHYLGAILGRTALKLTLKLFLLDFLALILTWDHKRLYLGSSFSDTEKQSKSQWLKIGSYLNSHVLLNSLN